MGGYKKKFIKGNIMSDTYFYLLLEQAFDNPTEQQPATLGNVQFFKENGNWCYTLPVTQWNYTAVATDLSNRLKDKRK